MKQIKDKVINKLDDITFYPDEHPLAYDPRPHIMVMMPGYV